MLQRSRAYRIAKTSLVAYRVMRRYRRLSRREEAERPPSDADYAAAHEATAQDLHDLAVDLEGLFIKLCQMIGARGDVFPEPFVRILGRFHDAVPPRPFKKLERCIEKELGGPISEFFTDVDETPLAAASLAQVHRARLKDGSEVVLKVQYPEIAALVRADLTSVRRLSKRWMPKSNLFDGQGIIDETSHFLELELDFSREAESTERIRKTFASDPRVRVPRVYAEHTTKRLLVLEFLDGLPLTDPERLKKAGVDQRAFVENVATIYAKMIFEDGFFHGDPHPGNLLVLEDGVIGLLDFGLAKELPDRFGPSMAAMIAKSMTGDTKGALEAAQALGFNIDELSPKLLELLAQRTLGGDAGRRQPQRRERGEARESSDAEPGQRRRRRRRPSREQREKARARREELELLAEDGEPLRVPPHFALVGRTVMLLEGLSHRLAPGEKIVQRTLRKAIAPYALMAFGNASKPDQG